MADRMWCGEGGRPGAVSLCGVQLSDVRIAVAVSGGITKFAYDGNGDSNSGNNGNGNGNSGNNGNGNGNSGNNGNGNSGNNGNGNGNIVNPGGHMPPGLNRGEKGEKSNNPNKLEKPDNPGTEDSADKNANNSQTCFLVCAFWIGMDILCFICMERSLRKNQ